ncbi:MAG: sigma-70 family RNA polymerase sigma factor [Lentisphaeraceae bacterium]|nr:sigma-70 family RNA polymerase sigma factor [Lentisphaeraceae bacterium]
MQQDRNVNHGEFIKLFASVQPALHRYICSLLPHFGEAEDILQEVAVTSWEKFSTYDPEKPFQSWVFGIARNKVLHSKRRFARTQNLMNDAFELKAEEYFQNQTMDFMEERQDALNKCVDTLNEKQQTILHLRYKEKLQSDHIGEKLKRSAEQVRTQLCRLRAVLKTCITNKLSGAS